MKECNLKRHYESRHEAKYDNVRRKEIVYYQSTEINVKSYANYILIVIWYLNVVKTFAARNKFPHAKVARNTKKVGQA